MKLREMTKKYWKIILFGAVGVGKTGLALTLGSKAQVLDMDDGLITGQSMQDEFTKDRLEVDVKTAYEEKLTTATAFPKAKLLAQFAEMAEGSTSEKSAQELKTATAYMVCSSADSYSGKAFGNGNGQSTDRHTILEAWRGHWSLLIAELNAAGNPFV